MDRSVTELSLTVSLFDPRLLMRPLYLSLCARGSESSEVRGAGKRRQ